MTPHGVKHRYALVFGVSGSILASHGFAQCRFDYEA